MVPAFVPWTPCRPLARDLPETTLHATSPRLTPRPSTVPLTCANVWPREVLQGVVNHRRIDGKDGVAGSIPAGGSTQALTRGRRPEPLWPTRSALEWDAKGQLAARALITLLTSNVGCGVSGTARIGLVAWR